MYRVCVLLIFAFCGLINALDQVAFLFKNQELCDQPFADAQWIPVLDLCELECKPAEELCVENDELTQKCKKLPKECVGKFEQMQEQEKQMKAKRVRNLSTPKTTLVSRTLRGLRK